MRSAIARAELIRQLRRPLLLVGAALLAAVAFNDITITSPTASGLVRIGRVANDAPVIVSQLLTVLAVFGTFLVALVVGASVRRDVDSGSYPLVFTSGVRKADYLGGRFLGSFGASTVLLLGGLVGIGAGLATLAPEHLAGLGGIAVAQAVVVAFPTLAVVSALFFAVGTLSRSAVVTYVSAVAATVLFFVVLGLTSDLIRNGAVTSPVGQRLLALADPSGLAALEVVTGGWSVAQRSTRALPMGYLLLHRALWLAVAAGLVGWTSLRFRLAEPIERPRRKKERGREDSPAPSRVVPDVAPRNGLAVRLRQLGHLVGYQLGRTVKHLAFVVLVGVLLMQLYSNVVENVRGAGILPRTGALLNLGMPGAGFPIVLLTLFFAGVLVWRERDAGEDSIHDALPIPNWVDVGSKLAALVLMQVVYAVLIVGFMMAVQVVGYWVTDVEPGAYLAVVGGVHLLAWVAVAVAAVCVQALAPTKTVGFAVTGLGAVIVTALPALGVDLPLLRLGAPPNYVMSDMNGLGPFVPGLLAHGLVWGGLSVVLVVATALVWPRGRRRSLLAEARQRAGGGHTAVALGGVAVALAGAIIPVSGGHVFEAEGVAAAYETRYAAWEALDPPRLTDVRLDVDLDPEGRQARVRGEYRLVNAGRLPLDSVLVTLLPTRLEGRPDLRLSQARAHEADAGGTVFVLDTPLPPGDSARLSFDLQIGPNDAPSQPDLRLVENGMLLDSFVGHADVFPLLGYRRELAVADPDARARLGLAEAPPLYAPDDSTAPRRASRDWVTFEATVGTSPGQVPIATGRWIASWTEGDRPHARFRTEAPIAAEFAVLSGRYAVVRDTAAHPAVEVLHHPDHVVNVPRMIAGARAGLRVASEIADPYPYGALRIVEVPGYGAVHGTAISKPTLFLWTETGGFTHRAPVAGEVDRVFSTAAHEAAHQWWAHRIRPATATAGAVTLNETIAQYVRLRSLHDAFDDAAVEAFLDRERAEYLWARGRAARDEAPLDRTTDGYVAYQKGSLAMNALSLALGVNRVDRALGRLAARFSESGAPTATDLVAALHSETPDSLQVIVTDWFETITFVDHGLVEANARPLGGGRYAVTMTTESRRVRADGRGVERAVPFQGPIEVAVYDAEGRLLARPHRVVRGERATWRVEVDRLPTSVEVDPRGMALDRSVENDRVEIAPPS